MKPPADTTAIAVSVCFRCGTIAKSGKDSCCGRGGSWFQNCGGDGETKLRHTWYEGIQACKTRSQSKIVGQQLNSAHQKVMDFSQRSDMTNYKTVIVDIKKNAFTSLNISTPMSGAMSIVTSTHTLDNVSIIMPSPNLLANTLTDAFMTSSTHTSVSTPIITPGYVNLLKINFHINLLFVYNYILVSLLI